MATPYEIPLSPQAQKFQIELASVNYWLTFFWSVTASCWMLNIADTNQVPIVGGIAVVTGVDLLGQYGYLNFGGQLIVQTDFDITAIPDFDNLGLTGRVYFVVA